jgi:hypothetical protein
LIPLVEKYQDETAAEGRNGDCFENLDQIVQRCVFPDAAIEIGGGKYKDFDGDDGGKA